MTEKYLNKYIIELQTSGITSFTRQMALKACGMSPVDFQMALAIEVRNGLIISPKKEFYVIVSPEYHNRPLPCSLYIDQLMDHLKKPYYIGVLTAASLYGASHQQPMEFQVVTKGAFRDIELPEIRIRFLSKKNILEIETEKVKTKTGYMKVSTPEVTAFDLIKYISPAGYLDNVANVLIELAPKLRARKLAFTAKHFETSILQRLGYLLDEFIKDSDLTRLLWENLERREPQNTPLSIYEKNKKGELDKKWLVWVNEKVEPDL